MYLDLINVNLFELLLHFLAGLFHDLDRGDCIFEALCGKIGLLHIKGLVLQLVPLPFVHFLLLQHPKCPLFDGILMIPPPTLADQGLAIRANTMRRTFPAPSRIFAI